eukprot:SAG11_NODE_117_length_15962_cov_71.527925_7_plen_71_part_00
MRFSTAGFSVSSDAGSFVDESPAYTTELEKFTEDTDSLLSKADARIMPYTPIFFRSSHALIGGAFFVATD